MSGFKIGFAGLGAKDEGVCGCRFTDDLCCGTFCCCSDEPRRGLGEAPQGAGGISLIRSGSENGGASVFRGDDRTFRGSGRSGSRSVDSFARADVDGHSADAFGRDGNGSSVSSFSGTSRDDSTDLVDSAFRASCSRDGVGEMRPRLVSGIMMGNSSLNGYVEAPESLAVVLQRALARPADVGSSSSVGVASVEVGEVSEAQRSSGESEDRVVLERTESFCGLGLRADDALLLMSECEKNFGDGRGATSGDGATARLTLLAFVVVLT